MINLERKEDCCGCSACESICKKNAIKLKPDTEGFGYPYVDSVKCVDRGVCGSVCPVINRKKLYVDKEKQAFYAVRHKNEVILKSSSSGGAFSAIAQYVIEHHGIVYGATYDQNMVVRHISISHVSELPKLRGSKYVQSDLCGLFREIESYLIQGRLVLFTGTPCQAAGLRLFLRKEYAHLFTIDLVCHAAGSPMLFKEYVEYLERQYGDKLIWMNMRDKEKGGWNHHFVQKNWLERKGPTYLRMNMISWWRIYYSHMTNRPSCHECKFTNMDRCGDITLADFWDDRKNRPDIFSAKGTSLLIVNTRKGETLLQEIDTVMISWPITKEDAWQPCLEHPTKMSLQREVFWNYYYRHGAGSAFKKFFYISKKTRYMWKIKDCIAKWIGYGPKN